MPADGIAVKTGAADLSAKQRLACDAREAPEQSIKSGPARQIPSRILSSRRDSVGQIDNTASVRLVKSARMIDYRTYNAGPANDILVVEVTGRLDNDTSEYFFGCLEWQINDGNTRIVLDCSDLVFLSSLGVGTLMRIQSRLKSKGGTVKLAAVQNMVADVLRVVYLDRLLDLYPTVDEAVASFGEA